MKVVAQTFVSDAGKGYQMLRRYSVNFELFSILLDTAAIFTALPLVVSAHRLLENAHLITQADSHELPGNYYVLFPVLWIIINLILNLYDGRSNVRFKDEVSRLMLSMLSALVGLAGLLFFSYPEYCRSQYVAFILSSTGLMGLWRVFIRLYWRLQYLQEHELRRVLIVGAGDTGRRIAVNLSAQPESNLQLIGFLDDDPEKLAQNQDILGATRDLERIVAFHHIHILVLALPAHSFDLASNIVYRMRLNPVKIWIVPNAHRLALYHCNVEYISDIPIVDIRAPSISERQRLTKRLFDLVLSFAGILIFAPVMIIIAVLIKLDSPGPIIFRQKRVGENTQPFEILKFRTMVKNAEALSANVEKRDEQGNILHKHPNDPRVTRIGRLLRHYSLDELPQIFNVLLGKMSLVGPRPELPHLVENYKNWQYVRFTVPQGLTGWWQVNGRSDKPMHLNTEADLHYIRNYSIWLDIMILWKTIRAVLKGNGAF